MITRPTKAIGFVTAFLAIQGAVSLQAAVNMISVEHRVWGDAGDPQILRNTYDETGPAPLSRNATGVSSGGAYASSSASDWSLTAYRNGNAYHANAFAQNTYVFTPFSREISISLSGQIGVWWFENQARMTLTDLNTNSLVSTYQSPSYTGINPFSGSSNDMTNYPVSWNTALDLDPEHQYRLVLFVGAKRGEGGDGSASLNLTLVPEPAISLLAGMVALLVCGRRRRAIP
jgi:hypothetical protein